MFVLIIKHKSYRDVTQMDSLPYRTTWYSEIGRVSTATPLLEGLLFNAAPSS